MESSKKMALSFISAGFIFVSLFWIISVKQEKQNSTYSDLAVAEVFKGEAFLLHTNTGIKEKLIGRRWIHQLESIETSDQSDVVLEFNSNYRIKINPQSQLTLDQAEDSVRIIIKKGDVSIENYGTDGSLFISKDGQKISAADYGASQEKSTPTKTMTSENVKATHENRLTQKMIQDHLKNTRGHFYKCYSQLLQKTPGVSGQTSIAFTILPTGKVSDSEVSSSSLADTQFKKCLVNVIDRVEFPSFSGASLSTVFPIRFE